MIDKRRTRWGELLAWGAFAITEEDPELAYDMALVAKMLLNGDPIETIPLAAMIAENTLAAAEQR